MNKSFNSNKFFIENLIHFIDSKTEASYRVIGAIEAGKMMNGETSDIVQALNLYPPKEYMALLPMEYREVSPYLIDFSLTSKNKDLDDITTFNDWMLEQDIFTNLGFFMISQHSLYTIYSFLLKYMSIESADGSKAYFRFCEPRFFNNFFTSLPLSDKLSFSDMCNLIIVFDYYDVGYLYLYTFKERKIREERVSSEEFNLKTIQNTIRILNNCDINVVGDINGE